MLSGLVLSSSALSTGCLVAEAPEYGPQQQRPPVIDTQTVKPSQYELFPFNQGVTTMSIDVQYRSEDAGENLVAALYLDWDPMMRKQEMLVTDRTLPASSFDDEERHFSYPWSPSDGVERNCAHALTLLLMHESSYDDPFPKEVKWDVASVTWQFIILDPTKPNECSPQSGTVP